MTEPSMVDLLIERALAKQEMARLLAQSEKEEEEVTHDRTE